MSQKNTIKQKILQSFSLTTANIADLASFLKEGFLSGLQASYRFSLSLVKKAAEWFPNKKQIAEATKQATEWAKGIAETFKEQLGNAVDIFLEAYEAVHGTLEGIMPPLKNMLRDWTSARTEYKSVQIADYTVNTGTSQGTQDFANDIINEDIELPDDVSIDDLAIAVFPFESSPDECASWAGRCVPLSESSSMPNFPMHANCIHHEEIINLAA